MISLDLAPAWMAPYRETAARVLARMHVGDSVAAALNAELDAQFAVSGIGLAAGPLRFVPVSPASQGEAYESFIVRTASVPTRDNLHDLLNGLVWLRHPALKRWMNERQAAELAHRGVGARRGAVRDALTLLDENGACLRAPRALIDVLIRRDWRAAFVTHRAAWREADLTLVGHALLEKLAQPRKAITAHVWMIESGTSDVSLDPADAIAQRAAFDKAADLTPHAVLPVLGVPGWWPDNELAGFYEDTAVFRPTPLALGADRQ